ncbi:MAG: Ig-like domain-containing protein, partial [bacterium]
MNKLNKLHGNNTEIIMKTKFVPLYSSVSEKICIAVIIFLSIAIPNFVAAQLQILATNPKQGSILVDAKNGIEITFDRPMNTSTLSTASVKVFGDYHGLYNLSFNFDSSSNILRILPSPAFIDGESVTAILTTVLRATDGSALVRPFRLAFRTKNPFGNVLSANFEIRDIPLLPGDQQPAKIALGDFNHDDFIDAAVVNSTSNTATIQINTTRTQRATTLSPSESYATGTTPIDIASADFDADGNLDLAIANFASNDVSIHWGQDDGSFISQPTF